MTILIIPNKEIGDTIKIVKSAGLLIKEIKRTKRWISYHGTLGVSFLDYLLTSKEVKDKISGKGVKRPGERAIRAGEGTVTSG